MPKEREVREVLRRLPHEGWLEEHGKGSHVVFRKNGVTVSIPTSRKELGIGIYRQIARMAGWQ